MLSLTSTKLMFSTIMVHTSNFMFSFSAFKFWNCRDCP